MITNLTITDSSTLAERIRQLGEDTPDPGDVASAILESITPAEAVVIAQVTLRDHVRRVLVARRPAVEPAASAPSVVIPEQRKYRTAAGESTRSPMVAALRDWVAGELARSIFIESTGTWKHLAECTAADLRGAAKSRRRQAAEVSAEADRFDALADAAETEGVEQIGQVARPTLERLLK